VVGEDGEVGCEILELLVSEPEVLLNKVPFETLKSNNYFNHNVHIARKVKNLFLFNKIL
jgi:hypothetical protein